MMAHGAWEQRYRFALGLRSFRVLLRTSPILTCICHISEGHFEWIFSANDHVSCPQIFKYEYSVLKIMWLKTLNIWITCMKYDFFLASLYLIFCYCQVFPQQTMGLMTENGGGAYCNQSGCPFKKSDIKQYDSNDCYGQYLKFMCQFNTKSQGNLMFTL